MIPQALEPPHNFDAEMALLGSILNNNQAWHRCSEIVDRSHFADPLHAQIYEAIGRLIDRGQEASVFALKAYLDGNAAARAAGGGAYLARLLSASAPVHDARQVGQVVRDLHLRRQIIALGTSAVAEAYADNPDASALDQIEALERGLYDLASTGHSEGGFQTFTKALTEAAKSAEQAYKRDGKVVGVSTGSATLDSLLGGLHRSDLIILAGRPSMGKTALATNIAFHAARAHRTEDIGGALQTVDGAVVGFFSLEMSAEQLATRIVAEQAAVSSERIRKGEMKAAEFDRVLSTAHELEAIPLYIDDTPGLTISGIRTRARRLKRMHGLGLVVVDYLQLIIPPKGIDSRVNQVGEITRGLKILAKELDVPVLALSQLSREVEKREDKRPQLADLRDSGAIEQDADVVMFVFREEYYARKDEPQRKSDEADQRFADRMTHWQTRMMNVAGRAEIIIDKQRHGPVGKAVMKFDGTLTRFSDVDQ